MSSIAQQECHVKESLFQFINKNIPTADVSVIDEIVLAYVISILEEASQDPCFDVEGFIEMMAAYVPTFADIDPGLVCSWVLELEAELSRLDVAGNTSNRDEAGNDKMSLALQQSLSEMLPTQTVAPKTNRTPATSETLECSEPERPALLDGDEYPNQCTALQEMFPNSCIMEIKHCVSIACGDAERAAATLLHRRDHGQAMSAAAAHPAPKQPTCDDKELKSRIIARYSYVDRNSDTKEHKPLAPKVEPKKMVRYRDNKIVSLKGERYTEVAKSGNDEENLKKPKKQHSP